MKHKPILKLDLSASSYSLFEQLKRQSFIFDEKKVTRFDELKSKLYTLRFCGILTDSELKKTFDRLFKQIKAHVEDSNH